MVCEIPVGYRVISLQIEAGSLRGQKQLIVEHRR